MQKRRLIRAAVPFVILLACVSLNAKEDRAVAAIRDDNIYVASITEMKYPTAARMAHTEGVVVIRAQLDGDGKVTSAEAISGPADLLKDSLSNVKKWRFHRQATEGVVVVYEFQMEGYCSEGSHFTFRKPNIAVVSGCNFGDSTTPGISPE
jgi:TonB family protein